MLPIQLHILGIVATCNTKMPDNINDTLNEILTKLNKLDSTLKDLESRTKKLEEFETTAAKDIEDVKHSYSFMGTKLEDSKKALDSKIVKQAEADSKQLFKCFNGFIEHSNGLGNVISC